MPYAQPRCIITAKYQHHNTTRYMVKALRRKHTNIKV
uniref:Uncharacterized protein n=1 Tax=Arundo donax TaxID=35708 RepID=A0A0A9ERQ6_ARUDO